MKSMTGFGRGAVTLRGRRIVVELRTVSHRSFDSKLRARDLDAACEAEVGRVVRSQIARGSVSISVREEGAEAASLDVARVKALHASLEAVRVQLGLPDPVDLATVGAFLGAGPA